MFNRNELIFLIEEKKSCNWFKLHKSVFSLKENRAAMLT